MESSARMVYNGGHSQPLEEDTPSLLQPVDWFHKIPAMTPKQNLSRFGRIGIALDTASYLYLLDACPDLEQM